MQNLHRIVAVFGGILVLVITTVIVLLSLAVPTGPLYETEDFSGYPPGLIVAGAQPDGGEPLTSLFPRMRLSVRRHDAAEATLALAKTGAKNMLVIAGNVIDTTPHDGYLDNPQMATDGGIIVFDFNLPTIVKSIRLARLGDHSNPRLTLYRGLEQMQIVKPLRRGEVYDEAIELSSYGDITRIAVDFSGRGAIERIEFTTEITSANTESWGFIKSLFN